MGNRYWVAGGVVLGVLVTVVLAGVRSAPSSRYVSWEYGIYVTGIGEDGQKRVSWFDTKGYTYNYSPYEFCRQMNIPASNTKVDEMALTPVYELTVFNFLGEQGWDLVSLPQKESRSTTYIFKRSLAR